MTDWRILNHYLLPKYDSKRESRRGWLTPVLSTIEKYS